MRTESKSFGVLLLAAGKGERLKPITEKVPKPLININGIPLIAFPIYSLVKAGFRDIIVNTHHLPEILEDFLIDFGRKNSISFTVLREEKLLGTGGTIRHVFEKFGFDEILAVNSDIIGYFDIPAFLKDSRDFDSIAHILIYPDASIGGVQIESATRYAKINGEGKGGEYAFCGVHVVRKDVMEFLKSKNDLPICIVRDGYIPALSAGKKISYSLHKGFFSDIGTQDRLKKLDLIPQELVQDVSKYFKFL